MSCFIIGAGSFYGLPVPIQPTDTVIAADGGWEICRQEHITPTLLVADFDSLGAPPDFDHILRLPVVKDDTDMIRAVKEGFARGETEFHLLGGMGGRRTDHTVANMQTLAAAGRAGSTAAASASRRYATGERSPSPPVAAAYSPCSAWVRTRRASPYRAPSTRWRTPR